MLKLLMIICLLTLNKISDVKLCSSSTPSVRPRPPAVPEYVPSQLCVKKTFEEYKNRVKFISEMPNTKKIGELSLVGTHQSISYSLTDNYIRKQELDIMNQLLAGVRVLDITLYVNSNILMVSTGNIKIGKSFAQVLDDVNIFLSYNQGEIVIIKLSYKSDEMKANVCYLINEYRDNNIGGSYLISDWNLDDIIGWHRRKILLVSEDRLFKDCVFSLKTCLKSNDIDIDTDEININSINNDVDRKWMKYLAMVNSSFTDNYPCNIYDLTIKNNYISVKNLAKYGGYYFGSKDEGECLEPMNFKISKYYPKNNLKELNIYIVDYVTQEVIDRINDDNFID